MKQLFFSTIFTIISLFCFGQFKITEKTISNPNFIHNEYFKDFKIDTINNYELFISSVEKRFINYQEPISNKIIKYFTYTDSLTNNKVEYIAFSQYGENISILYYNNVFDYIIVGFNDKQWWKEMWNDYKQSNNINGSGGFYGIKKNGENCGLGFINMFRNTNFYYGKYNGFIGDIGTANLASGYGNSILEAKLFYYRTLVNNSITILNLRK